MTDLEYIFRRICERRGVKFSKIESVAFNTRITFGLANGSALLPVVANVFYYILDLNYYNLNGAGVPGFTLSGVMNANGSAGTGTTFYTSTWPPSGIRNVECDAVLYDLNGHSGGTYCLSGTVLKITYS